MIVIADTSPINYLILIGEIDLLKELFSEVIIPVAVFDELNDEKAPQLIKSWLRTRPTWLEITAVEVPKDPVLERLERGEREAIALAEQLKADLILIDERYGRRIAIQRGLRASGLLFILETAAELGLLDLSQTFDKLRKTNFRISEDMITDILRRQQGRDEKR